MKGLLFTYVLTYGGSIVALVNPFHGLLVYICFAIIRPPFLWHWSVPQGNYSRTIGIALLLGWAMHGFGNWSFGRGGAVVKALLAFAMWNVASAALARDQSVAWTTIVELSKIILPFLVGVTIIRTFDQLKILSWVITLSLGYIAFEANLSYLFNGRNWISQSFGGMDNNCNAISLVCGTGFAFFLGLAERSLWRRGLAFAAAALMAHAIMLSNSRGGMLALLISGAVSFVLIPKKPINYGYLVIAGLIAVRMAGPSVVERFSTAFAEKVDRDYSAQSRLDLWQSCIHLMQQYPLLGIGPSHFPLYAEELGHTAGKQGHTLWLQVGAEIGLPGLMFLLAFYLIAMKRLWQTANEIEHDQPEVANYARMVIAALVGFMVAAQFVSLVGLELPYYVTLVGVGVLMTDNIDASPAPLRARSTSWRGAFRPC
jgi:probable O-glycosylation ligase (exosortase A-associated)